MARIARVVMPGVPHHVVQRGNRRQETFFRDKDYRTYLQLMSEWCGKHHVDIWAYCLMPNHIHLIAVPQQEEGLRLGIGEAHRRYTRYVNKYKEWVGYLWQGRFSSCPLSLKHLMMTARYIEQNPVRAGMVKKAESYPWSSARAHLRGEDDVLVKVSPLLERVKSWKDLLQMRVAAEERKNIKRYERTGRPLGDEGFVRQVERELGRSLAPKPSGRPRKKRP
ncbi:MAG: transposase [Planctomycetes bacterium RBG_16_59_8]|nr:MAG: transposase [Planctomycetes bacterium RBG_16_59_8]